MGCLALITFSGCRTARSPVDRGPIDREMQVRMAESVATKSRPGEIAIPPHVNLADGLTEDEAIALALWNNRDFLATLANLGIARGDLVQAGLLTNPQLNLLFPPIGTKQLEWTLFVPIDAIILRKQRQEIAERDFQRVCNELVQNGLNVARDARVAFADFQFATDRYELAQEVVEVRAAIADLAQKRLAAGDTGELEAISTRLDANRSRAEAAGLRRAVQIAEARLKLVMGIAAVETSLVPVEKHVSNIPPLDTEALLAEAMEIRPDIKAARIAVQAAEQRVALARKSFLRIDAAADGNHGGLGPNNVGPGFRLEIPIFNRNEGLVVRSEWTVDQASHNYYSVRDRVVTDVRTSIAAVEQAHSNLQLLREMVFPDLQETMELSEAAYESGGDTYFLVLQSISQFIDSRIRELELEADLRRAIAELDRSVGRRVTAEPVTEHVLPVPPKAAPKVEVQPEPRLPDRLSQEPGPESAVGDREAPAVTVIVISTRPGTHNVKQDMIAEWLQGAARQCRREAEREGDETIVPSALQISESVSGQ